MSAIIVNAVALGFEASIKSEEYKALFNAVDTVCIAIFTVEILLKLGAKGRSYFHSAWNVFDFAVIAVSVLFNYISVLRALRIIRMLRLVAMLPKLSVILESLMRSLPGIGWITALLCLLFYMFSVIFTFLFGDAFPALFGGVGASMYSALQLLTLEGWSTEIVNPVLEVYPYALFIFIPFILIASYIMVNFFVAIIVNSMSDAATASEEKREYNEKDDILEEIKNLKKQIAKIESMAARQKE
jgi:voltage-gated sodium channel